MAETFPPPRTETRLTSQKNSVSGKLGKAKQRRVVEEKTAPRNEKIIAYAKNLLGKGAVSRSLGGKVSRNFPELSERQVRRILRNSGLIKS